MNSSIVIMGVAGCGKSHIGSALAVSEGWSLIEGDDFHSEESRRKMSTGTPLTDADREGWLAQLGLLLAQAPSPVALTCSALKRRYRDQLRAASPGLRFVFLQISREESLSRVAARSASHFFPVELVDNQFATLELPVNEALTLTLDATLPVIELQRQISAWLRLGVCA
jgi:gluconokinase